MAGSIGGLSMTFPQTGAVFLYNLSNPQQQPLAVFSGDRRYSRFGGQILVNEVLTQSPLTRSSVSIVSSDFQVIFYEIGVKVKESKLGRNVSNSVFAQVR